MDFNILVTVIEIYDKQSKTKFEISSLLFTKTEEFWNFLFRKAS